MNCCIIFGGAGFIGGFFLNYLLENNLFEKVYLFDIAPNCNTENFHHIAINKNIEYIRGDVRKKINISFKSNEKITLILNFAAIHREPGHINNEYFETNLLGAENVCLFAEFIGCQNIIFTSSISPYGVNEANKDESTTPVPVTAYGSSKLVAEKIHQIWQAKDAGSRRLVIVRPGVVFGPGEGGNVSRLISAVLNHYFFYMGNKETRKAGVYVKELCIAMWWVFKRQEITGERVSIFNMSMNPAPSISEYVKTICKVANVNRLIPSIPYLFLLSTAYFLDFIAKPLRIKHPFSPVRVLKLVHSNNIIPTYLINNDYQFTFTLESAFSDWRESRPEEWQ
jgi:nucleoside-diphosphate-sugar epimerase